MAKLEIFYNGNLIRDIVPSEYLRVDKARED